MSGDNGLVILGIDPGTRCTGFGVVRERSGVLSLIAAGTVRPGAKKDMAVRLGAIHSRILELVDEHGPHEAAMEEAFCGKNVSSALKLGQARGAIMAACAVRGLSLSGYEPTLVKKSLVGVGRADKSQVSFMVGQVLGVKPDWAEDAGDALAVAICHLNNRRMARLAAL